MRYGFVNNFSQILASDLAAGATTMTLDGNGSLLSAASADLVYTLTLDDGEGTVEIVHVTAASGNNLTIERGKEGTSDATWPSGSQVEMRLTAGAVDHIYGHRNDGIIFGDGAAVTMSGSMASIEGEVIIGWDASIPDDCGYAPIAIGSDAYLNSGSAESLAIGGYAGGGGAYSVAIGASSYFDADECVAIGYLSQATFAGACSVGYQAQATYTKSIAVGRASSASGDSSVALGASASSYGSHSIAFGNNASASSDSSVAIGAHAISGIPGGLRITALSYLPVSPVASGASFPASAAPRASQQVVIATDPLDLTTINDVQTLNLPAGAMLFIDSIEVVVTGSDTPGGSPAIQVGTDVGTPADLLAATAVGKTAVGGREKHTPLLDDGVTSIRAEVTTAGTGTTYQARVIVKGYVMEL